jgi:hypothetical protein
MGKKRAVVDDDDDGDDLPPSVSIWFNRQAPQRGTVARLAV